MDIWTAIEFADDYSSLGDSVQAQFKDLMSGDFEDLNPNAVKLIRSRLNAYNIDELTEKLEKYKEWLDKQEE